MLAVPELRAAQVIHILVLLLIALHSLRLAAAGIACYCHYQCVLLCVRQQRGHTPVAACLYHLPLALARANLARYRAPHVVCYQVPVAVKHLTDCRARHAFHTCSRFVLAAFTLCVGFQRLADNLFLFRCHNSLLFLWARLFVPSAQPVFALSGEAGLLSFRRSRSLLFQAQPVFCLSGAAGLCSFRRSRSFVFQAQPVFALSGAAGLLTLKPC